jgi:hypothetical protein
MREKAATEDRVSSQYHGSIFLSPDQVVFSGWSESCVPDRNIRCVDCDYISNIVCILGLFLVAVKLIII